MILVEESKDGKSICISDSTNRYVLDYDEAKALNSRLSQFINNNYYTRQLLPCRVCGNTPEFGGRVGHRTVKCITCGVYMDDSSPHTLINKWNRYNE